MRTVILVNTPSGQVVPLPHDMSYKGINELEIHREGDVITLRPVRSSWTSFSELPKADADFLIERRSDAKQRRNIADSLAIPDGLDIELEPPSVEIKTKPADFT
jgi:antitoxin VapB